jgi:non-ribosomal peptide synthetase component F
VSVRGFHRSIEVEGGDAGGLRLAEARAYERGNFPLTAMALPGDRLTLALSYDTGRLDGATAARTLERWRWLLAAMAESPELRLSELRLLDEAERREAVERWSRRAAEVRQIEVQGAGGARQAVAPRDPVERLVAGTWAEVLGVPIPSVHDSFFELGGHSLTATQVVGRVNRALGTELPIRTLFEHPTVAALAAELVGRETVPGRTAAVAEARLRLAAMSPEEVERALAARRAAAGRREAEGR